MCDYFGRYLKDSQLHIGGCLQVVTASFTLATLSILWGDSRCRLPEPGPDREGAARSFGETDGPCTGRLQA